MSLMISELYDALRDAGASEEKARKAAEALTAGENRFSKIEADLLVNKWIIGFAVALSVAIASKVFLH
jgi:hypothetical protein